MSPTPTPEAQPIGLLVLIVEDEILVAMDHALLVEQHGWRVLGPAATVAEALHLLDGPVAPDVALLDVNLRGENVTPVAEELRSRGVPFVLISAYDHADLRIAILSEARHVSKPAQAWRLFAAVEKAMLDKLSAS